MKTRRVISAITLNLLDQENRPIGAVWGMTGVLIMDHLQLLQIRMVFDKVSGVEKNHTTSARKTLGAVRFSSRS